MGLLPVAFIVGMESGSFAFHNGGVGACEACHSMHSSYQGSSDNPLAGSYLLKGQDSSSTCLNCHSQPGDIGPTTYHIGTPVNEVNQPGMFPKQLTPGGDFGWLNKTFSWYTSPTSLQASSPGERHGHNIVAADFLYDADGANTIAPGGTYPSSSLSCISCHDPHGKYRRNWDGSITTTGTPIVNSGSFASSPDPNSAFSVGVYRLLGGQGYLPKSLIGGFAFLSDPPPAVAPDKPNRSEAITQTRVAYGSYSNGAGMSEWCKNCHPNMHTAVFPGPSNVIHATGKLVQPYLDNYNKYIQTGAIMTSPTFTPYLSLVPFEEGTADYTTLKSHAKTDDTWLAGPDSQSQITCLTCHRAHASGWDGIMRWNTKTDYLVYNQSYAQAGQVYQPYGQGRTEAEARQAYYDRPSPIQGGTTFAPLQDTLCNKCHIGVYP
jgi:hypothetical protein